MNAKRFTLFFLFSLSEGQEMILGCFQLATDGFSLRSDQLWNLHTAPAADRNELGISKDSCDP